MSLIYDAHFIYVQSLCVTSIDGRYYFLDYQLMLFLLFAQRIPYSRNHTLQQTNTNRNSVYRQFFLIVFSSLALTPLYLVSFVLWSFPIPFSVCDSVCVCVCYTHTHTRVVWLSISTLIFYRCEGWRKKLCVFGIISSNSNGLCVIVTFAFICDFKTFCHVYSMISITFFCISNK